MKCTDTDLSCIALAAIAALATATLDSTATADGDKKRSISASTIVIKGDGPSSVSEAHTIDIRVEDGELTVTIDGQELPASRFRAEDGELVILDEDGRELKSFGVLLGKDDDFHITLAAPEALENTWSVFPEGRPNVLIGVHMAEPDEALRYHLRLEDGQTTLISGLYKDLPAHKAGLDQYDVIVAVDGQRPADPRSIMDALADKEPGDEVTFTVIQRGRTKEYGVTLEAFDAQRMDPSQLIGGQALSRIVIPGEGEIEIMPGRPGDWRQWFVDPRSRQFFRGIEEFRLPKGFQKELRRELRDRIPSDLDERMEDLNRRLDEVREMINQLVEQARELAEDADEG